jgi:hypothetical protein
MANTLRVVYWWGHHFDEALLCQSAVMLITMFVMLNLCVRVERLRKQALNIPITEKYFTGIHAFLLYFCTFQKL